MTERFLVTAVLDVPPTAVSAFQQYEAEVLSLLDRHGGRLDRRLRNSDGTVEVHVLSFASRSAYQAYLDDPERLGHRSLLGGADIAARVIEALSEVRSELS